MEKTKSEAEEILMAARILRRYAKAANSEEWGDLPWAVEECSDTDGMESCACIVSQGIPKPFDQPQIPAIQYVADAENPDYARYIALMHPGLAIVLADWLETEGNQRAAVDIGQPLPGARYRHSLNMAQMIIAFFRNDQNIRPDEN
jgi:hypothetical protein